MAQNSRRVVKYKKPRNINIGIIIFGVTFIYLLINIFLYFSRDKVMVYEVVEGGSGTSVSSSFTGLALRDESVTYAQETGYINFYVRDASHISVGTNLYTIDESGRLSSILAELSESDSQLSDDTVKAIRDDIYNFTISFDSKDFATVYDFKYNLEAEVLEDYNLTNASGIDGEQFEIVKSDKSGTVVFYTDGYEGVSADTVTGDDFEQSSYKKSITKNNNLVEAESPIFKVISPDSWVVLIPLTDEEKQQYEDTQKMEVMFLKDDLKATAAFDIIENAGGSYGRLSFSKYSTRYINDRFLELKILGGEVSGLKIPKSSVVEKEFYMIPDSYLSKGGDNNDNGFYKEVTTEEGEVSIQFITPAIYKNVDGYCYVDTSALEAGDVIIMNDSSSRFQIGEKASLKGVYNVNSGYADFKQIEILSEVNDYYIIEKNTRYGLANYDHIVLDSKLVKENEVVYQ